MIVIPSLAPSGEGGGSRWGYLDGYDYTFILPDRVLGKSVIKGND